MREDPSTVLQGISSQEKTVKIPNSTDTETITKLLHELGFTSEEFAGRLINSDDKKVLVVYQTAIQNGRVSQSYRTLMCLVQLCELTLSRSVKKEAPLPHPNTVLNASDRGLYCSSERM